MSDFKAPEPKATPCAYGLELERYYAYLSIDGVEETMSDFKAPDVVWIDKETLTVIQDCKSTTNGHIGIPDTSEVDVKLGDPAVYPAKLRDRQTLTTSVEKNTRKAVREALEKVKSDIIVDTMRYTYDKEPELMAFEDGVKHCQELIDQLLTQYQEVAS